VAEEEEEGDAALRVPVALSLAVLVGDPVFPPPGTFTGGDWLPPPLPPNGGERLGEGESTEVGLLGLALPEEESEEVKLGCRVTENWGVLVSATLKLNARVNEEEEVGLGLMEELAPALSLPPNTPPLFLLIVIKALRLTSGLLERITLCVDARVILCSEDSTGEAVREASCVRLESGEAEFIAVCRTL